jgi:holo-[acyl-carrier protein] synthase
MIVGIGVDTVDVARIARLWQDNRERFVRRVFTPAEADYCAHRSQPGESLAARFAAKEAVMKCLRSGWAEGVAFRDIEVVREPGGAVALRLQGIAAERARALGIRTWHLSLTHTPTSATAFVVAAG